MPFGTAFEKTAQKPQGWWKGDPMSPDGVKSKTEFQGIPIHLDRPKGFVMKGTDDKGVEWKRIYKYDYGFIPKTEGGDGDGLDVFIGPNKTAQETYWAIQNKADGSFDEYKIFVGFNNRDEAVAAYREHIPLKLLGGMVTLKIDMMKAMLGMSTKGYTPSNGVKTASIVFLVNELEKVGKLSLEGLSTEKLKEIANKYLNVREMFKTQMSEAAQDIKQDVQESL